MVYPNHNVNMCIPVYTVYIYIYHYIPVYIYTYYIYIINCARSQLVFMPPRRRSCKRDSCLDLLNSKIFIVHALAGIFETDLCTFPMQGMIFFQAEDTNARFRNQHLKKFLFPSHYPPLRRDRGET